MLPGWSKFYVHSLKIPAWPITTTLMTIHVKQMLMSILNSDIRVCLPQKDLDLIRFWLLSGKNCDHGNAFISSVVFVGV